MVFFLSRFLLLPDLCFFLYAVVKVTCSSFFFSLRRAPISERAVSALAEQVFDSTLEQQSCASQHRVVSTSERGWLPIAISAVSSMLRQPTSAIPLAA